MYNFCPYCGRKLKGTEEICTCGKKLDINKDNKNNKPKYTYNNDYNYTYEYDNQNNEDIEDNYEGLNNDFIKKHPEIIAHT